MSSINSRTTKAPIGLALGIAGGIIAIIIVIGIIFINILSRNPVVGSYELYSTIKDDVESVDTADISRSLGVNIVIEFRQNGIGQISTIPSTIGDEAVFSNSTTSFSWQNNNIDIISAAEEDSGSSMLSFATHYELVDKDYVIISGDDTSFKVKFKRIE